MHGIDAHHVRKIVREISERARDTSHTVVTAPGQPTRLEFGQQQGTGLGSERGVLVDFRNRQPRVRFSLARIGDAPRGIDTPSHHRGRLRRAGVDEIDGRGRCDRHTQVESVEQRTGQSAQVTLACRVVAHTRPRRTTTTRTRIRGPDEKESRRQRDRRPGSREADLSAFERLTQCVEDARCELAHLVEEENTAVRQRHLTRTHDARPTADHRNHRGTVVRGPERRQSHETTESFAGRRPDHRRGEGIVTVEWRQQTRNAFGEHRLATPGTTDKQQVVATRGRNLRGTTSDGLAPHVTHVGRRHDVVDRHARIRRPPLDDTLQGEHDVAQRIGDADSSRLGNECITTGRRRNDDVQITHRGNEWRGTGYVLQRTVEPELCNESDPVGRRLFDLALRDQNADGECEIEARTTLAPVARCEVHRDATVRPFESARQQSGANTVTRLSTRFVGKSDDTEAGKTRADVHLDADGRAFDTEQRRGIDACEHVLLLPVGVRHTVKR